MLARWSFGKKVREKKPFGNGSYKIFFSADKQHTKNWDKDTPGKLNPQSNFHHFLSRKLNKCTSVSWEVNEFQSSGWQSRRWSDIVWPKEWKNGKSMLRHEKLTQIQHKNVLQRELQRTVCSAMTLSRFECAVRMLENWLLKVYQITFLVQTLMGEDKSHGSKNSTVSCSCKVGIIGCLLQCTQSCVCLFPCNQYNKIHQKNLWAVGP